MSGSGTGTPISESSFSLEFRLAFPEFTSLVTYPSATIDFWASVADDMLNTERWGDRLDYGKKLFVAHHLVMAIRNQASSAPGQSEGVIGSQSAGPLSVSFDTTAVREEGAGFYNLTSYGTLFWKMAKIVGIGGAHV